MEKKLNSGRQRRRSLRKTRPHQPSPPEAVSLAHPRTTVPQPCCSSKGCLDDKAWSCRSCRRWFCVGCRSFHGRNCGRFYSERADNSMTLRPGAVATECVSCDPPTDPSQDDVHACSECNQVFCRDHFLPFVSQCKATGGDHAPEVRLKEMLRVDARTEIAIFAGEFSLQCCDQECADDITQANNLTVCKGCLTAVCDFHATEMIHHPACESPKVEPIMKHFPLPASFRADAREACSCFPKDLVCRHCDHSMCRFHYSSHNRACKVKGPSALGPEDGSRINRMIDVVAPDSLVAPWGCNSPLCASRVEGAGAYGHCLRCDRSFCIEHSHRHAEACTDLDKVSFVPLADNTCGWATDGGGTCSRPSEAPASRYALHTTQSMSEARKITLRFL